MLWLKNSWPVSFLLAGYYCVVSSQGTQNQSVAQPTVTVTNAIPPNTTSQTTTELPAPPQEGIYVVLFLWLWKLNIL